MNHYEKDGDFEARRREIIRKRAAAKKKRQAAVIRRSLIFAAILLVTLLVILSLTVLFPIRNIKVTGGDERYSAEQIIEASGIKAGENIWMSGTDAEANITSKLPYISAVEVDRNFPSAVVIRVKMATPATCYKAKNGKLLLCDAQNKVLEIVKSAPKDAPLFSGLDIAEVKAGTVVSFGNEEKRDIAERIRKSVADSHLKLNTLDVSSLVNIVISVEDRFKIKLGSSANLEAKILHLEKTVQEIEKNRKGTIDFTDYTAKNPRGIFIPE